jgi:hypothetical protein
MVQPDHQPPDVSRIRRVVTGVDPQGASTVLFDAVTEAPVALRAFPGVSRTVLWIEDAIRDKRRSDDRSLPGNRVGDGGVQCALVRIEPGQHVDMHDTPTVDSTA